MRLDEILSTAMDTAGGEIAHRRLDSHYAVGQLLNILETVDLELAASPRNLVPLKETVTFAAGTNTGSVTSNGVLGVKYIRWRRYATDNWQILDVVETPDELTRAENRGRRAVMFLSAADPQNDMDYLLSFEPEFEIEAELWGRGIGSNDTVARDGGLELVQIPREMGMVASYRLTDLLLNQLLIKDASLQAFVIAQKNSIMKAAEKAEFIWMKYLTGWSDAQAERRVEEFNILEEMADEFDVESGKHYRG